MNILIYTTNLIKTFCLLLLFAPNSFTKPFTRFRHSQFRQNHKMLLLHAYYCKIKLGCACLIWNILQIFDLCLDFIHILFWNITYQRPRTGMPVRTCIQIARLLIRRLAYVSTEFVSNLKKKNSQFK